ncbi:MAG: outer membrane lipoprotein chaperone LolA [Gammaproteobacteria bacterium]|nr:outer membrane lipoprotein chaperone LolA [Gammaproteobacteria bacterium]
MAQLLSRLFVVIFVFSANAVYADASEALSGLLQPLASISGNFNQVLKDERGEVLQRSSGHFLVQRPGKLRWSTDEPFPQLLVINNNKLWLYDPDLEQVTVRSVDQATEDTPALLLSGKVGDIRRAFEVAEAGGVYNLKPKRATASFKAMTIRFGKKGLPVEMMVKDAMGQTTELSFTDLTANPGLNAEQFEFKIPKGTDIIRDE